MRTKSSLPVCVKAATSNIRIHINSMPNNPVWFRNTIIKNNLIFWKHVFFYQTLNFINTSLITAAFHEIPFRSALLSRNGKSDHVIPLLELHLATGFRCSGRAGWTLYTSVSDNSKSGPQETHSTTECKFRRRYIPVISGNPVIRVICPSNSFRTHSKLFSSNRTDSS
jgi:hypothetical protein